jgi:hypothetical protein
LQYDSKTAALAGRHVLEVRYWDLHNWASTPRTWDYGDWHHAVMGVELLTDRGPSCVLWTSTFYPYGVEVFHTPMSEHVVTGESGPESWEASDSERWRNRLGSPVTDVSTFWEHVTIASAHAGNVRGADRCEEFDVPVALRIDFGAASAWMVAGIPQAPDMQEVFIPGDEIMVAFTAERMQQMRFPDSRFLATSPD